MSLVAVISDRKLLLPIILVVAFGLRAMLAIGVHHFVNESLQRNFLIPGDANGYWELGQKLASGEAYSIYDPPRLVMRMPGFPMFLATSIKIAGENLLPVRFFLAGVGTLACWLVYLLGKELFDTTTGLIAAGLTAIAPTLVGFSVMILSETLFAFCLVCSLIVLAKLVRCDSEGDVNQLCWKPAVFGGVLIALACYVRPSWLLVGPLFALLLVALSSNKKRAFLHGSLVMLGLFASLTPWMIRNYHLTGHAVVTTLWVGPSLYDGFNVNATGDSNMEFFEQDKLLNQGMTEYQVDQEYRKRAWDFVVSQPGRAIQLTAIKLGRFWKPWPNAAQFQSGWQCVAVAAFFVPMILLAGYGWWKSRKKTWNCLLTIGPILYFSAIHAIFLGSLRYRLPAEYPLCVMSAVGLQSWLSRNTNSASILDSES